MIKFDASFQFPPEEMKRMMKDIQKGVLKNIRSQLLKAVPHIERQLPAEIRRRIEESDVVKALMYSDLRYALGITQDEALDIAIKIPDVLSKLIQVRIAIENDNTVSFIVELVKDAFDDILNIPAASFVQTYTQSTPKEIPWLKWLLEEGNNIIIGDYRVKYTQSGASRSGGAIMIQKGSFRIPPEFSGTIEDNFITRALEGIDDYIYSEIQKVMNI